MHRVNFFDVYKHDSATEEVCAALAGQYKAAAKVALEKAGSVLVAMKGVNPDISIPWHYRPIVEKTGDKLHQFRK